MSLNEQALTPVFDYKNCPALFFLDGQHLFRMTAQNGTVQERLLSNASVRAAFTALPVDTGWLPPEVVRWGDGALGEWAVAYVGPARHEIELVTSATGAPEEVAKITVPLPGMVFFGTGVKYFAWAVKTAPLDPYQEVYRCPLPNVMQDASVCWGLHKPPRAGARTIMQAWRLFMTSTFNAHAAPGKSKQHREDVRELLKELAREDATPYPYPVADLMRQVEHEGITLDASIKVYFDSREMPG